MSERWRWTGCVMVEGVLTADGREVGEGAIQFGDPPLPLRRDDAPLGSKRVGDVDRLWREGPQVLALGWIERAFAQELDDRWGPGLIPAAVNLTKVAAGVWPPAGTVTVGGDQEEEGRRIVIRSALASGVTIYTRPLVLDDVGIRVEAT